MAAPAQKPADSPDLVYRLEDKPPFMNALLSAITHLLAIFVPMITPALIVGGALQLPVEMTAYLVSMAMVRPALASTVRAKAAISERAARSSASANSAPPRPWPLKA